MSGAEKARSRSSPAVIGFYVIAFVAVLLGGVNLIAVYQAKASVQAAATAAARALVSTDARVAGAAVMKAITATTGITPCFIRSITVYDAEAPQLPPGPSEMYRVQGCAVALSIALPVAPSSLASFTRGRSSVGVRIAYTYRLPLAFDSSVMLSGEATHSLAMATGRVSPTALSVSKTTASATMSLSTPPVIQSVPSSTPPPVPSASPIVSCSATPGAPSIIAITNLTAQDVVVWDVGYGVAASGGWRVVQYRVNTLTRAMVMVATKTVPQSQRSLTLDDSTGKILAYGVFGLNDCRQAGPESALVSNGR